MPPGSEWRPGDAKLPALPVGLFGYRRDDVEAVARELEAGERAAFEAWQLSVQKLEAETAALTDRRQALAALLDNLSLIAGMLEAEAHRARANRVYLDAAAAPEVERLAAEHEAKMRAMRVLAERLARRAAAVELDLNRMLEAVSQAFANEAPSVRVEGEAADESVARLVALLAGGDETIRLQAGALVADRRVRVQASGPEVAVQTRTGIAVGRLSGLVVGMPVPKVLGYEVAPVAAGGGEAAAAGVIPASDVLALRTRTVVVRDNYRTVRAEDLPDEGATPLQVLETARPEAGATPLASGEYGPVWEAPEAGEPAPGPRAQAGGAAAQLPDTTVDDPGEVSPGAATDGDLTEERPAPVPLSAGAAADAGAGEPAPAPAPLGAQGDAVRPAEREPAGRRWEEASEAQPIENGETSPADDPSILAQSASAPSLERAIVIEEATHAEVPVEPDHTGPAAAGAGDDTRTPIRAARTLPPTAAGRVDGPAWEPPAAGTPPAPRESGPAGASAPAEDVVTQPVSTPARAGWTLHPTAPGRVDEPAWEAPAAGAPQVSGETAPAGSTAPPADGVTPPASAPGMLGEEGTAAADPADNQAALRAPATVLGEVDDLDVAQALALAAGVGPTGADPVPDAAGMRAAAPADASSFATPKSDGDPRDRSPGRRQPRSRGGPLAWARQAFARAQVGQDDGGDGLPAGDATPATPAAPARVQDGGRAAGGEAATRTDIRTPPRGAGGDNAPGPPPPGDGADEAQDGPEADGVPDEPSVPAGGPGALGSAGSIDGGRREDGQTGGSDAPAGPGRPPTGGLALRAAAHGSGPAQAVAGDPPPPPAGNAGRPPIARPPAGAPAHGGRALSAAGRVAPLPTRPSGAARTPAAGSDWRQTWAMGSRQGAASRERRRPVPGSAAYLAAVRAGAAAQATTAGPGPIEPAAAPSPRAEGTARPPSPVTAPAVTTLPSAPDGLDTSILPAPAWVADGDAATAMPPQPPARPAPAASAPAELVAAAPGLRTAASDTPLAAEPVVPPRPVRERPAAPSRPMPPQDDLHDAGLAMDVLAFLEGKVVGQDIVDAEGDVVARRGDRIDRDLVSRVEGVGRLPELIVYMTLDDVF